MKSAGGSPGIARAARRWGVVGGGMLGLTLAHRLARLGRSVTVFEGADRLGGLASAWSLGPVTWDRHYHVTLFSDTALRRLLDELGLERELRWVRTRTGFYTGGRLHSMSDAFEFLRFPPLGLVDKARLALTILHASRIRDWKRLEQVPVADWLRRWSGPRTLEKIWLPLLRAKLGESYRETSAAFIWATIARLYAARRSGMKEERFGYVPGGYARILERLGEVLAAGGVRVRLSQATRRVERVGTGASPWNLRTARKRSSMPSSSPRRRPSPPASSPGSRTGSARGSRGCAIRGSSVPRCCSSGRSRASTSRTSRTTGCPSPA